MTQVPRIGSALLVRSDDAILVARRAKDPNKGKWIFPGGKIEPFESIQEAGAREIFEETGLRVSVGPQIGAFEIIAPPDEHRVIIFSWAQPTGGSLVPASDVSEVRFCTREEMSRLDLSEIVARVAQHVGWADGRSALAA